MKLEEVLPAFRAWKNNFRKSWSNTEVCVSIAEEKQMIFDGRDLATKDGETVPDDHNVRRDAILAKIDGLSL